MDAHDDLVERVGALQRIVERLERVDDITLERDNLKRALKIALAEWRDCACHKYGFDIAYTVGAKARRYRACLEAIKDDPAPLPEPPKDRDNG